MGKERVPFNRCGDYLEDINEWPAYARESSDDVPYEGHDNPKGLSHDPNGLEKE